MRVEKKFSKINFGQVFVFRHLVHRRFLCVSFSNRNNQEFLIVVAARIHSTTGCYVFTGVCPVPSSVRGGGGGRYPLLLSLVLSRGWGYPQPRQESTPRRTGCTVDRPRHGRYASCGHTGGLSCSPNGNSAIHRAMKPQTCMVFRGAFQSLARTLHSWQWGF